MVKPLGPGLCGLGGAGGFARVPQGRGGVKLVGEEGKDRGVEGDIGAGGDGGEVTGEGVNAVIQTVEIRHCRWYGTMVEGQRDYGAMVPCHDLIIKYKPKKNIIKQYHSTMKLISIK